eukprot:2126324-Prymnesium_polylepis.1
MLHPPQLCAYFFFLATGSSAGSSSSSSDRLSSACPPCKAFRTAFARSMAQKNCSTMRMASKPMARSSSMRYVLRYAFGFLLWSMYLGASSAADHTM